MQRRKKQEQDKEFEEKVLYIRRVSKKTTGGNSISFSALVAIGDGKGKAGIGLGTGKEVPQAIRKAIAQAKKNTVVIPIFNDTLPHDIYLKYKSARLLLKPAPPGTGLKLGGVVRIILDVAGVNNASGKVIGSRNQITNAYAVMTAIRQLKPRIVSESKKTEPSLKQEKKEAEPVVEKSPPVKSANKEEKKPKKSPATKKVKKETPVKKAKKTASKPKAKSTKKTTK
ncbi:30S ribosomal protein S5 [Candidatus Woesebacteria bacterium]|nr:30S ribosomal protein S5 [Candidatus Woesebacteria bacterium]